MSRITLLGVDPVADRTQSLCPECRRLVEAHVVVRDGRVYLCKRCPVHGVSEALVFGDADAYGRAQPYNKPGVPSRLRDAEKRHGCPYDCGTCPDHQQHACIGLIEVNNICNLDCPLCFADARHAHDAARWELTFAQVDFMLDRFIAAEGQPEVVQFSGGEPTLHPQILDFIALAQQKGITYVMLNTNGVRIANDDRFLAGLEQLKPHIYLQFDGFDERTNLILRGRGDLIETKLRTLDRLAEIDARVVLVPAIERGVNEHEVGRILEFGLSHPAVFGVNYQPAFRLERTVAADPLTRMTIPDVLKALEAQTHGLLRMDDFTPVPCCAPTCSYVTYAMLTDGGAVVPVTRLIPVDDYLDYIKNRTLPGLNDDLLHLLERLWSASSAAGSETLGDAIGQALAMGGAPMPAPVRTDTRCPSCHAHHPLGTHSPRDMARHVFMIATRDFMDPWTFNVKSLAKCCVSMLVPDGRIIPFCAYGPVGYREQVRRQLLGEGLQPLPALAAYA